MESHFERLLDRANLRVTVRLTAAPLPPSAGGVDALGLPRGALQQRTAHDFDRTINMVSDRRKRKATLEAEAEQPQPGFFWQLARELRRALVRMARHDVAAARAAGRHCIARRGCD